MKKINFIIKNLELSGTEYGKNCLNVSGEVVEAEVAVLLHQIGEEEIIKEFPESVEYHVKSVLTDFIEFAKTTDLSDRPEITIQNFFKFQRNKTK